MRLEYFYSIHQSYSKILDSIIFQSTEAKYFCIDIKSHNFQLTKYSLTINEGVLCILKLFSIGR